VRQCCRDRVDAGSGFGGGFTAQLFAFSGRDVHLLKNLQNRRGDFQGARASFRWDCEIPFANWAEDADGFIELSWVLFFGPELRERAAQRLSEPLFGAA
jgi:hypothetical protein